MAKKYQIFSDEKGSIVSIIIPVGYRGKLPVPKKYRRVVKTRNSPNNGSNNGNGGWLLIYERKK